MQIAVMTRQNDVMYCAVYNSDPVKPDKWIRMRQDSPCIGHCW